VFRPKSGHRQASTLHKNKITIANQCYVSTKIAIVHIRYVLIIGRT